MDNSLAAPLILCAFTFAFALLALPGSKEKRDLAMIAAAAGAGAIALLVVLMVPLGALANSMLGGLGSLLASAVAAVGPAHAIAASLLIGAAGFAIDAALTRARAKRLERQRREDAGLCVEAREGGRVRRVGRRSHRDPR